MPRKPRLHVDDAIYHVMLRGNAGQPIFADDADRNRWEAILAESVARHGHRVLAYCWMGNHVHLCLRVAGTPLSRIMQQLAFRYARAFNRRHGRIGHVFQGRFRALLVGDEAYRLGLLRYIHRNPLATGLERDPRRYRWSSHGALSGARRPPDWLECAETLALFARDANVARRRLHAFVMDTRTETGAAADDAGLWAEIEAALASPSVETLGSPPRAARRHAARRQAARAPSLSAVIDAAARMMGVDRRALIGRHGRAPRRTARRGRPAGAGDGRRLAVGAGARNRPRSGLDQPRGRGGARAGGGGSRVGAAAGEGETCVGANNAITQA
ncbi:MAG: transposase [Alphaproteobacteria bacterium]|nr:transposase [Alphaproteobacteria bacterium]